MRVSVPANIIVIGEYAVVEEGGLGITMAVDRRVYAAAEPAGSCIIEGKLGGRFLNWKEGEPGNPLLDAAYDTARRLCLKFGFDQSILRKKISIDSRRLFSPEGRKRGFGSSAAAVLSVLALLLGDSGLSADELRELLMQEAVKTHRRAQGGRGSGYDICTSLQGGIGLFTGGALPRRRILRHAALQKLRFSLASGKTEISSSTAVLRYEEWKKKHYEKALRFVSKSGMLVRRLAETGDPAVCIDILKEAADLGESLGRQIGVDAAPPVREPISGTCAVKCVGAGNETILRSCLRGPEDGVKDADAAASSERETARTPPCGEEEEIRIDEDGLLWE